MVKIEVCIGSGCYVEGASEVLLNIQKLVEDNSWQDQVSVNGCFCMKSCENHFGLGVRVNNEILKNITKENAVKRLEEEIRKHL